MDKELGIYVHIPFCIKKCAYCDFISYPNKLEMQEKYVKKILEEIDGAKQIINNCKVTTVYIGGGTPSAIDSKLIKQILHKIKDVIFAKQKADNVAVLDETKRNFMNSLNNDIQEVTIEVNPGTVTRQKLEDYLEAGVNRLSIGLQSTSDSLLKSIGRIHTYQDFLDTYNMAVDLGFKNISVDLMIGLPNQSIKDIKESIEKVTKLTPRPQHISVYSLIVEENTPMEKLLNDGKIVLPTDEEERNQYSYVKNTLEQKGYKHYEISNFCLPGKQAIHNTNCWEQKEYLGFGVAAHSYFDRKRFSNTNSLQQYLSESFEKLRIIDEVQSLETQQKEFMLLGLRKLDGVDISAFKAKFAQNPLFLFRNEIQKLVNEGLLVVDLNQIRLSRRGLDLANMVWEEFI